STIRSHAEPVLSVFCPGSRYKTGQKGATETSDFPLLSCISLHGFVPRVGRNCAHNPTTLCFDSRSSQTALDSLRIKASPQFRQQNRTQVHASPKKLLSSSRDSA